MSIDGGEVLADAFVHQAAGIDGAHATGRADGFDAAVEFGSQDQKVRNLKLHSPQIAANEIVPLPALLDERMCIIVKEIDVAGVEVKEVRVRYLKELVVDVNDVDR